MTKVTKSNPIFSHWWSCLMLLLQFEFYEKTREMIPAWDKSEKL